MALLASLIYEVLLSPFFFKFEVKKTVMKRKMTYFSKLIKIIFFLCITYSFQENGLRSQYLKLRTQLLQQRYNVDSISTSRSISARSSSRVSYVSINSNFSFLFILGCISTIIENWIFSLDDL